VFDVDFLFMIDHFGGFRGLLNVYFFLWELLNNRESSCFLFVILLLLGGQFLFLLIYIQLFVFFLLDHFHINRWFLHWLLCWFLAEILDNCQSSPSFVIFIHCFESLINLFGLLLRMEMINSDSNSFVLGLNIGLNWLLSDRFLVCNSFLSCGGFLDNSCLFGSNSLRTSLLFSLWIYLSSDLYTLLLMKLFMWLNHFNVVNHIWVWFLLWEILYYCQSRVLIIFVKFCASTYVSFCVDYLISVCIDLLSLLQLNMSIANWWFWFSDMGLYKR
jgi:hypothetical protein